MHLLDQLSIVSKCIYMFYKIKTRENVWILSAFSKSEKELWIKSLRSILNEKDNVLNTFALIIVSPLIIS